MTSVPTTDRARALADAGRLLSTALGWVLYAVGWQIGKAYRLTVTAIGGVLFAAGWSAGRVWLALRWAGAAVALGWDAGRKPLGGGRGPA